MQILEKEKTLAPAFFPFSKMLSRVIDDVVESFQTVKCQNCMIRN